MRDNQRRSRQRRKDYIYDLETKTRDFEAQRIQASIELQQAARRVKEENESLKTENRRLTSENDELKRVLALHSQQCGLETSTPNSYPPTTFVGGTISPAESWSSMRGVHHQAQMWQYGVEKPVMSRGLSDPQGLRRPSHIPYPESGYGSASRSPGIMSSSGEVNNILAPPRDGYF